MESNLEVPGVREEVFTTPQGLVGILTLPPGAVDAALPAVIVLNSGNMHRVGAGRISVTMARRLAGLGHVVLRFDHAGVGDSAARRDGLDIDTSRVTEIREVMSILDSRFDVAGFVLYGLCSGARDAFHAAIEDDRVRGLVQIDGFAYRTLRFRLNRLRRRLANLGSLPRLFGRLMSNGESSSKPALGADMFVQEWPEYPPRVEVEAGYRRLVERGLSLYVAYTGSWYEEYNYRQQFQDMYPGVGFEDSLTLRYMPTAAHTLPDPAHRRELIDGICEWIDHLAPADARALS